MEQKIELRQFYPLGVPTEYHFLRHIDSQTAIPDFLNPEDSAQRNRAVWRAIGQNRDLVKSSEAQPSGPPALIVERGLAGAGRRGLHPRHIEHGSSAVRSAMLVR